MHRYVIRVAIIAGLAAAFHNNPTIETPPAPLVVASPPAPEVPSEPKVPPKLIALPPRPFDAEIDQLGAEVAASLNPD